jgi:predicted enzyme related to lactoylglutathione lyase
LWLRKADNLRIALTSVFVDDQRAALAFYTEMLGFTKRRDVPVGDNFWLTVVSPESPDGPELLLEPSDHAAVKPYQDALVEDGIPLAQFDVDDIAAEHARPTSKGVVFTQPPTDIGTAFVAVFDDTCGNFIQLIEGKPDENHADAR